MKASLKQSLFILLSSLIPLAMAQSKEVGPSFQTLTCTSSVPQSDAIAVIVNVNPNTGEKFLVSVVQTKPVAYHNLFEATASFSGDFWNYNGRAIDGTYFHLLDDSGGDGNIEAGYTNPNVQSDAVINIGGTLNNISCK